MHNRDNASAKADERMHIRSALDREIGLEPGMRFVLREGKCAVGAGVVTAIR